MSINISKDNDFRCELKSKGNTSDGSESTNIKWTQEAWTNAERPLNQIDNELKNIMIEKVRNIFGVSSNTSQEKIYRALGESFTPFLFDRLFKEKIITEIPLEEKEKEKKGKKNVEKKSDIIKKENSWKIINKELDQLFQGFNYDGDFHLPSAFNSKYIEIRGIGFIVCCKYLLKNSKKFIGKSSKTLFVNNIIVGMQKFINATRNLVSQSIIDSLSTTKTSDKFLDLMELKLKEVKQIFEFNGMKICSLTPQLLIYTNYDCYIPTKSLSLYPHQYQLIDEIAKSIKNDEPLIVTLRTMTNTGKTTSALGIAEIINCARKYLNKPDMMFIFCCNIRQVMDQVSQLVFNAHIPFGIAFIDRFKGLTEINNFNCPSNDKRVVTVCGPDACLEIVKKYPNSVIFLDEPNINLDKGTDAAQKNVRLITEGLTKQVILSSATFFEKLPEWIIDNHEIKYGKPRIVDIYSNKIHIACEIKTNDGKLLIPHSNCNNSNDMKNVIQKIIANPFIGRTYTANMTNSLYNICNENNITDLPNITDIFDNAENLNADSLRKVSIDILNQTSKSSDNIVKLVSNTIINPSDIKCQEEKEEENDDFIQWEKEEKFVVGNEINFKTLCTTSAHRFMLPTLIATENPVAFTYENFQNIINDFVNEYGTVKKINDDYTQNVSIWQKHIDRAERGAKDSSINSKEERLRNEESIQLGKPTIKMSEFQINTAHHIRRYAKKTKNIIDRHSLRQELDVTEIMTCEMSVPDDIRILLACGVGIVGVYGGKYAHIVSVLMNEGKLAYIIANDSIAYGTNVPINIVIVTKEFSDAHSTNTIFQLISRAGRVGRSWNAEAFIHNTCAEKILLNLHSNNEKENIEFINFEQIHKDIVEASIEIDTKLIFELAQKKIKQEEEELKQKYKIQQIEEEKRIKEEMEKKKLEELRNKRQSVQISNVISKPPSSVTINPVISGFKRQSGGNIQKKIPSQNQKTLFDQMQEIINKS
jgi:hypothetical protein